MLTKPWRDPARYREAKLREAVVEYGLALDFMKKGFVRNTAGKAF
ncbi:PaREP1 family protein [Pyrobaculum aerophilum]|nr:PaREP1 family protein [Pyrobaculum aerophilum]